MILYITGFGKWKREHCVSTESISISSINCSSEISGRTSYFVRHPGRESHYFYLRKEICSARIQHNVDVIAIETLQFQKKQKHLLGSAIMIANSKNSSYQLFFVSS